MTTYHSFYTTRFRLYPPQGKPVYVSAADLDCLRRFAQHAEQFPVGPLTVRQLFPQERHLWGRCGRLARLGLLTRWLGGLALCQSVRDQVYKALAEAQA